jgi:uncharacterized protein
VNVYEPSDRPGRWRMFLDPADREEVDLPFPRLGALAVTEDGAVAAGQDIGAASITAIGAFRESTVGYFDPDAKEYLEIPVKEQAEILCLVGDLTRGEDDESSLHAHVVLGLRDGTTRGGHLLAATVRPTLEVMVTESPVLLRRRYRPEISLALIDIGATAKRDPGLDQDPLRHGLAP